jgi:bifunctional non-homologous end joining protein LigD
MEVLSAIISVFRFPSQPSLIRSGGNDKALPRRFNRKCVDMRAPPRNQKMPRSASHHAQALRNLSLMRTALTFCKPMLAKLVSELPQGPQWQCEMKWVGCRVQVIKQGMTVRVLSRRGKDFTKRFAPVAPAAAKLKVEEGLLDGEVVAVDERGRPSFQALQGQANGAASGWFFTLSIYYTWRTRI